MTRPRWRRGLAWTGGVALVLWWGWSVGAICYSGLSPALLRGALAALLAVGAPLAFFLLPRAGKASRGGVAGGLVVVLLGVLAGWLAIRPSHQRDWSPDQAVLPTAEIDGDRVTVRNVRFCAYATPRDYTVAYEDRTYDLARLESVDYLVELLGGKSWIAHTFLSFGFGDGEYLAVSVEIRKERGERFSAVKGLYRQYEIMYVLGDERDLIHLRANLRRDPVFLYPVQVSRERVRTLFLDVLDRVNRLARRPEFYHTLTNTCTTNIVRHVDAVAPEPVPFSLKVLFPGYSDRLAYGLGLIDTSAPFPQVRDRHRINARAWRHRDSPAFSRLIRQAGRAPLPPPAGQGIIGGGE